MLLAKLLSLLEGWAPAFGQQRTCGRAIALALVRFKEVSQVLWQRGGGRRLLRLFVLAPTPYRKTEEGRRYYPQKAYLLCDSQPVGCQSAFASLLRSLAD